MARKTLTVEGNKLNMKLFHDLLVLKGCEIVQTRNGMEVRKGPDRRPLSLPRWPSP